MSVAAAAISVWQLYADFALAESVSNEQGKFCVSIPPGRYIATARADGDASGHSGIVVVEIATAKSTPVKISIGDQTAVVIDGSVVDQVNQPVSGVVVQATEFHTVPARFQSKTDAAGRYKFQLPSGDYFVELKDDDWVSASERFEPGDKRLDLKAIPKKLMLAAAPMSVVSWLQRNVVVLETLDPAADIQGLEGFARVVGDARVVGLGEATHGTREFFQLKHRLFRYLVEESGFTVFLMEASFAESLAVNQYILNGKGTAAAALSAMHFWIWDTEEVLALLEWMREYNADPSHKQKVMFFGVDMQYTVAAATYVIDYLAKVDPELLESSREVLETLSAEEFRKSYREQSSAEQDATRSALADLARRFDAGRDSHVATTGPEAWLLARQHLRVLEQAEDLLSLRSVPFETRDRAMAENVAWILTELAPNARAAVWAHDAHVARWFDGARTLGYHLSEQFGSQYAAIGFSFNRGAFQARDRTLGPDDGVTEVEVPPAPVGSIGGTLSRVGHSSFVVDLRARPATGEVAQWFEMPHQMRSVGAVFVGAEQMLAPLWVQRMFDALVFVEKTTRARPTPTGRRRAGE